jgi:hypothetical protein
MLSCIACGSKRNLQQQYEALSKKIEINQQKARELNSLYQKAKEKGDERTAMDIRKQIFNLHRTDAELFEEQKKIRREL